MNMITNSINNWKTTVTGLIMALLVAYKSGAFDGQTGPGLYVAIALAAIGFLAKDADVTGIATKTSLLLWGLAPLLFAGALTSCSQSQLAAYLQFASVVPITVGGSYDNITATWNSKTGITLLYNQSGQQVASVVPAATAGTSSAVVVPTTSGSGFANLTATVNPATGAVVLYNSSGTAVATIAPPAPASSSTASTTPASST